MLASSRTPKRREILRRLSKLDFGEFFNEDTTDLGISESGGPIDPADWFRLLSDCEFCSNPQFHNFPSLWCWQICSDLEQDWRLVYGTTWESTFRRYTGQSVPLVSWVIFRVLNGLWGRMYTRTKKKSFYLQWSHPLDKSDRTCRSPLARAC